MPQREDNKNLFLETLDWICQKLETAGITYMITGGSAVGFWGHIRTTMDIDILIKIQPKQILPFLKSIEGESYVDIEEAKRAIFSKEMFNVILHKTSFKVDIIPLDEKNAYAVEEFKNRVKVRFQDKEIFVVSPEDLVISKLIWSKLAGGSEKQLKDCESIISLNREKINLDYILKWVKDLKLDSEFKKI